MVRVMHREGVSNTVWGTGSSLGRDDTYNVLREGQRITNNLRIQSFSLLPQDLWEVLPHVCVVGKSRWGGEGETMLRSPEWSRYLVIHSTHPCFS